MWLLLWLVLQFVNCVAQVVYDVDRVRFLSHFEFARVFHDYFAQVLAVFELQHATLKRNKIRVKCDRVTYVEYVNTQKRNASKFQLFQVIDAGYSQQIEHVLFVQMVFGQFRCTFALQTWQQINVRHQHYIE